MLQNILTVVNNPRDNIFNNSFLIPAPFLATLTTLLTVLFCSQNAPSDNVLKCILGFFWNVKKKDRLTLMNNNEREIEEQILLHSFIVIPLFNI